MKQYFRVVQKPCAAESIGQLESALGHGLPKQYKELLLQTDGAEWAIHDDEGDCLLLWPTVELIERNADYEIQRWLPDVVAIGSDGGGDAIVLDRSASPDPDYWSVARVPFAALERDEFILQAQSFAEWVTSEFRLKDSPPPVFHDLPYGN